MLEVALTVLVYGGVASGALLTLYVCNYLGALANKAKAQTDTERTLHR